MPAIMSFEQLFPDGLASTIFADHSGSFFYGIASMWCWITPTHRTARLAIQYIWVRTIWLTLATFTGLYSL